MATWQVTISGKGIRRDTVEKIVEKALREKYGEGASITVTDASPPESRADRFSEAMSKVSDAKGECEALRDELDEWKGNMPESLQNGSKAEELDAAIGELEEVIQELEAVEGRDVSFPGQR